MSDYKHYRLIRKTNVSGLSFVDHVEGDIYKSKSMPEKHLNSLFEEVEHAKAKEEKEEEVVEVEEKKTSKKTSKK